MGYFVVAVLVCALHPSRYYCLVNAVYVKNRFLSLSTVIPAKAGIQKLERDKASCIFTMLAMTQHCMGDELKELDKDVPVSQGDEKRKYRRLALALDLSCRKAGDALYTGRTANVSPGGLFFETPSDAFEKGNLLSVELSIPPSAESLEFGGKISGLAEVLRIDPLVEPQDGKAEVLRDASTTRYGVAVQFCRPLKFAT
jgi:hypothetical protein